jgi:tripartite-type tricarboxylate transporter receptor subunit TctC
MFPMSATRRFALTLLAALCAGGAAHAQGQWPNKPVRMIVPLAAGSAVDVGARIVAQKMSQNLGQSIVIENQPGAAGLIGAGNVAKAAPDGYTFGGFNDSIMTMVPHMNAKMPWDILKDFEPVSLVTTLEWGLVVNAESNIRTAADLIAAAKKAPGQINYGSGGNGSPQHIAMALFSTQSGTQMKHVPYKGATQAAMGVAGKEVEASLQGIATVNPLIRSGKLRLIGVPNAQRMAQFPDVPTISESGLPGFEFNSWFTIVAPAGTPKNITNRMSDEVRKALADPEVREKLHAQGMVLRGSTPEELAAATRTQLARYGNLIRQNNITAE